ncbi:GDSL-type esterase/lipase family protein [Saltatorellus ferox]|uniref:GDSL-type esterase/lipase family protein n=1 Tax=Saltatorellus ferox TaxID=2528018 RepID=UPI003AF3DFBC
MATWDLEPPALDGLAPLAAAGVPLFLVVGTADQVVPPAENAERLRSAYLAAGGEVTIWRKPGLDHHPHGLDPVAPLLRALLRAAGQRSAESEPSLHATPSAEYRGQSAGWGGGTWRTAFASLQALEVAARDEPPMDVVFLGDSITQGLTGHSNRRAVASGDRAFDRFQGERRAISLGLSGDRTEHLLYRIAAGSLDGFRPRVIVLQIGVNNIHAASHTGNETFQGIVAVVKALRARFPSAEIVIAGPFPAGADPEGQVRRSIDEVHARLASAALTALGDQVHYLDLSGSFVDEEGQPRATLGRDSLHITEEGRHAWMAAMEPVLSDVLR